MPNVTLSIPEALLRESREYARQTGTKVNQLVRDMLTRRVKVDVEAWLEDFERKVKEAGGDGKGYRFNREELYREMEDERGLS